MERIELITSKEYWVETLETLQKQGHTDYDIATVIVNKMEEAMNYIPCCKSDSEQLNCECEQPKYTNKVAKGTTKFICDTCDRAI